MCLQRGTDWIINVTAISFHLTLLIENDFFFCKTFFACRKTFLSDTNPEIFSPESTLQSIRFFQEYLKCPYSFASCTTIAVYPQTLNNFGIRDLKKIVFINPRSITYREELMTRLTAEYHQICTLPTGRIKTRSYRLL